MKKTLLAALVAVTLTGCSDNAPIQPPEPPEAPEICHTQHTVVKHFGVGGTYPSGQYNIMGVEPMNRCVDNLNDFELYFTGEVRKLSFNGMELRIHYTTIVNGESSDVSTMYPLSIWERVENTPEVQTYMILEADEIRQRTIDVKANEFEDSVITTVDMDDPTTWLTFEQHAITQQDAIGLINKTRYGM